MDNTKDKIHREIINRMIKSEMDGNDWYTYICKSCGIKFNMDIIDEICYSCHCAHTRIHHAHRDSYK